VTVAIDSLPIAVHGHQPQSEYNGHHHARIYHPLIAMCATTEDLLDVRLPPGVVHTADGADDFVPKPLDRVERKICQVASFRMDAGFPSDHLPTQFEARGTAYVARLRNNAALDRLAESLLRRRRGRQPPETETTPCDADAHNEIILSLNALAFSPMHADQVLTSSADGRGWSLQRARALAPAQARERRQSGEQKLNRERRRCRRAPGPLLSWAATDAGAGPGPARAGTCRWSGGSATA